MNQTDQGFPTPITPAPSTTRVVALIALAYALLGAAGLTLATASGYASPVFPAAGLALACALWFERRALPGIWLGAIVVNMLPAWFNGTLGLSSMALALLIATGATAQAWAGCWLVNRWLGPAWRDLEIDRDIFLFLLLGGILACVLSSAVGVTGLYVSGIIPGVDFLFTWWNWYVGDLLGVLVFAPLTLCLLSRQGALWRARRKNIIAPMLFILCLTVIAFYGTTRWERQVQANHLQNDAKIVANRIDDRLITHREVLSSLRHFIEATPDFSFHQFEQFTRLTLQDNPDIFALSFNDLITDKQRPAFERKMSGLSPLGRFQIMQRDQQGHLVKAAARPEYVVVRYIVPLASNKLAVGYDINSEPVRRNAIFKARASESMAVTSPVQLVQEQKKRVGILELLPVKNVPKSGVKGQQTRLLGFAVSVVKVDEMIDIATKEHVAPGLVFQLRDTQAHDGRGLLYTSDAKSAGNAQPLVRVADWETWLNIGDHIWELSVYASENYRQQHRSWTAWGVGVAGLLFAALLQIMLLGMTGRTALIQRKNEEIQGMARSLEEKVIERTGQLSDANRKLTSEIIERKTAEEALKEREGKINAILQNTVDGIISISEENIIETFNPAAEKIFGYMAAEAIGKNLNILMPEPHHSSHDQYVADYLRTGIKKIIGISTEAMARRKNGQLFQAELSVSEVIVGDRRLFTGLVRDITERKKAEEALQKSEEQVRLLLNSTAEAIYGIDLNGNCTFANPSCLKMLGYADLADLIGKNMHRLIHHSYPDGSPMSVEECRIYRAFHERKGMHRDDEVLWKADGSSFPAEYWSYPKIENGEVTGAVVTFVDITERKQAEMDLIKARELAESATRSKSEFLASMSHEIRTPMNAIIGMADLLLDSPLTKEQSKYVDVFRSAGENLLRIINDILDFSKIEAGQVSLESIPFSLNDLLRSVIEIMAFKAAEHKIGLSYEVAQDIDNELVGDPSRLTQILLNLVGNALKFTTIGSVQITVAKADKMPSDPERSPEAICLQFAVKDTGLGIPPAMVETIFDKFTQVDSTISRKFGGTGLGLAICRQLVTLMAGRIWVESAEGKGSTFYFTACLKKSRQQQALAGMGEEPQTLTTAMNEKADHPLRILLVEDNEDNRLLILSYLKKLPHAVDVAGNGLEAVEKIRAGAAYDLILMDVQMPTMDGYTATRHIRDWEAEQNLKPAIIIALTAHALREDEQKSVDAGCDGHLTKPIRKKDFLSALQSFSSRIPSR